MHRFRHAGVPLLLLVAAACAGGEDRRSPSPIRLPMSRNELPAPGLCRVWVQGVAASDQALQQRCEGIDFTAPLGALILMRPDDGSRTVLLRYMSRTKRNAVIGIDLFDIDTGRLIRVVQSYTGDPPA